MEESKVKQSLVGFYLSSFMINLGFGTILPFLSIYSDLMLTEWSVFGWFTIGRTMQIGLISSAMMLSKAFLSPFYGEMSDKAGRKPVIVVGFAMYVILTFGFGLANSFWSLFLVRFVQGIASALVWPVSESAIVDLSTEENTGRNLGWFMLSMAFGWSIGPFLGSGLLTLTKLFVASRIGAFRMTFILMGGINLIAFIVFNIIVIDPSTKTARMSAKEIWGATKAVFKATFSIKISTPSFLTKQFWRERSVSLKAIFVMVFSDGFAFSMIFPIMSLFLISFYPINEEQVGMLFGIAGIAGLVFNPIGGYISDKTDRKKLVVVTAYISAIAILFLGIKLSIFAIIILFIIRQLFQKLSMPASRALRADLVEEKNRGREFGYVQMFYNLGAILGPVVGGAIYDVLVPYQWEKFGLTIFGVEILFMLTFLLSVFATTIIVIFVREEDYIIQYKKEPFPKDIYDTIEEVIIPQIEISPVQEKHSEVE